MKAFEILEHFYSLADWVDPEKTVDKIIIGDPEKEVKRILVCWMSDLRAVKAAIDGGYDMLMTHEPTFWIHANEIRTMDQEAQPSQKSEARNHKRRLIEESGLVIMRNHDVWDLIPEIGIPWAWADFLGIEGEPVAFGAARYQHRYDIEPISLDDFARRIAQRTALIGEPQVQVFGDGGRLVSKVGIGTGCACSIEIFKYMGCDVSIVCDDGSCYWHDISWAMEIGHPVIRVNHGTSEEPGMVTLTKYINENLEGVEAVHLPRTCGIRLIGREG